MSHPMEYSNDDIKKACRCLHKKIVQNVDPATVADALFGDKIIETTFLHELQNETFNKYTSCRRLMKFLHSSGNPEAFVCFFKIISEVETLSWLVDEIKSEIDHRSSFSSGHEEICADPSYSPPRHTPQQDEVDAVLCLSQDRKRKRRSSTADEAPNVIEMRRVKAELRRVKAENEELKRCHGECPGAKRQEECDPGLNVTMLATERVSNYGKPISGLAVLKNKLLAVRRPTQQQIEVYDTEYFNLLHKVPVENLSNGTQGLTVCQKNNFVYICDCENHVVVQIRCSVETEKVVAVNVARWQTDCKPMGASVDGVTSNVLITCWCDPKQINKLMEFTSRGQHLRTIDLFSEFFQPFHVIQLEKDQFALSHGDDKESCHRVCVVNEKGKVLHSYGEPSCPADGPLNKPGQLAFHKKARRIFVADESNDRILMFDLDLQSRGELPVTGGLKGPWALCLVEDQSCLYIGEWDGGRIFVIDINFNHRQ